MKEFMRLMGRMATEGKARRRIQFGGRAVLRRRPDSQDLALKTDLSWWDVPTIFKTKFGRRGSAALPLVESFAADCATWACCVWRRIGFACGLALLLLAGQGCATLPEATVDSNVALRDFKLSGEVKDGRALFTLGVTAKVTGENGGSVELLSGNVALTEVGPHPKWELKAEPGKYVVVFTKRGEYPVELKFSASVKEQEGWSSVDFKVAQTALQPIALRGLGVDTQFRFAGAARFERKGDEFAGYLPADGAVKLAWKEAKQESEGKLFYAAEMLSQVSVGPGLMRQAALLDFKVMQGELSQVALRLHGAGEVTRVQGAQVLAWNVEPATNGAADRLLVIKLNQAQKDQFTCLVQLQTALGAFPQTADVVQLKPEGATRFAGYFRIVNDGAVRLEVADASGVSQISPEQFPESDVTKSVLRPPGNQRFVYRFSGADFAMRVQADQILPEVSVSELLAYHNGENELDVDAELELDIRDAPVRELLLRVPKGYAVARLNAANLSDYFVRDADGSDDSELRMVFGQPISGRQVVQLRMEHNQALGETNWVLPRIEVAKAKSVRGFVGVSADAGFRLTPLKTQSLTEIATAFYPGKLPGIQAAFRLSDAAWSATMRVERLEQNVQADVLHLFSIGEGIAYGSSVINYQISGAPVSAFKVELSPEYFNVEFTGKDIRSWQKADGGFLVQLHTPVSGAYTLLATYERPFKSQGETLTFTGARPVDAQSEQGHTLVVSAYQFQVKPVTVSPGLLPLETGEVPPEYRLFFDAPILAAYRYTARPFNLQLALSPLTQGDSLSQVVDRASFETRISKEGQALTKVKYFVKNRGNPNFSITLPEGTALWSATVNSNTVVPVTDAKASLIPLPQRADPDAVLLIELTLAMKSPAPELVHVSTPVVAAPVMLAEWKLEPDAGRKLIYRSGSMTPATVMPDISGYAGILQMFDGQEGWKAWIFLAAMAVFVGMTMVAWRWSGREEDARFGVRHRVGLVVGLAALAVAGVAFFNLLMLAPAHVIEAPSDLTLLAPVQLPGSVVTVDVANVDAAVAKPGAMGSAWPLSLSLVCWVIGWLSRSSARKTIAVTAGWTFAAWAALRMPNGAQFFLWLMCVMVLSQFISPALKRLLSQPRARAGEIPSSPGEGAPSVVALWAGILLVLGMGAGKMSAVEPVKLLKAETPKASITAESVMQEARVEDMYVLGKARIHWQAEKGQTLPLLWEPAVLTSIDFPKNSLKMADRKEGDGNRREIVALESGAFDIELKYEMRVASKEGNSGFALPVHFGLINRLSLTITNLDVELFSAQAVSIEREWSGGNTVAKMVMSPVDNAWIGWKPRSRDVKNEKSVFYVEISQLYVPSAGVIEGTHVVSIRPAQGELSELLMDIPAGATITDVMDAAARAGQQGIAPIVSLWRFDPDQHKLRVSLNPAQSKPFTLVVRSQVSTGPLPVEQTVGLISVENAAGQIGLFGVGTGNEVQLDSVTAAELSPINLEDFPGYSVATMQAEIPGLTLHRAFRYSDGKATAVVKASPVEADVRVESQSTLSLGEDRTLLAEDATVDITRAGIFRLSFVMPPGFDVESISGQALSHWTETKGDSGRVITLHLSGKTEGQTKFSVSLAGPGLKATNGWHVPQVVLREAGKQRGTLVVVPEQGMRLQVATREGMTQLDPQKSGIKQKGVLAFRILQTPSDMALDVEQVDAWIQVTSLQHAKVNEAQVRVTANLQYQIENTGLKSFRVFIPTNAESVHFSGDQVADYLAISGETTNGLQGWEVKLHRRVIGQYLLQATYQTAIAEGAAEAVVQGVQAADVNLQRGFVTVESAGRLQLKSEAPAALQPTEWQSIPRVLQQDLHNVAANFAYRLVEPAFQLPLKLERHEAAKLLPARVRSIQLSSVISDDGVMLTRARLEILPGDKRLLGLTLPKDAKFWFAFVNQNGVWPWREQDHILIPLEQESRTAKSLTADFYYSCRVGTGNASALNMELLAPKFDLPLENLKWNVSLNDKWDVKKWAGSFQLQQEQVMANVDEADLKNYLDNEIVQRNERTKEAVSLMSTGNAALQQGEPSQARRAFQAAYGLSAQDSAFNEDARVQLHNIKLQQALVGLNVRQAATAGDMGALGANFRDLRGRKEVAYTQQDAKDMIDRNTADDNAAFMRLAERIIQQQDAAVSTPAAIRATIPEQGRMLTFTRAVAVEPWADLKINLRATAEAAEPASVKALMLGGFGLVFLVLVAVGARLYRTDGTDRVNA